MVDQRKQMVGLLAMLGSAVSNALQQTTLKLAVSETKLPAQELLVARVMISFVFLILPAIIAKRVPPLPASVALWPFVLGRGISGGSCMVTAGFSTTLLPLGDAQVLQDMYPIVTAVFASLCLREPCLRFMPAALLLSIMGTTLIAQPSALFGGNAPPAPSASGQAAQLGYVFGIVSSALMACNFILARKAKDAHPMQLVFWLYVFQALVALASLYATGDELHMPSTTGWEYIAVLSALNLSYMLCMTTGSQLLEASLASFLQSTDIVWAYMLQVAVFNQQPSRMTLMGVGSIFVAMLLLLLGRRGALATPEQASQPLIAGASPTAPGD